MPVRRGLIAWSKTELPEATLNARIARARAAMREAGLDALLLYTNNTRPAAVTWLSAFVPYFSDGLLLVPREGKSVLVVSMSKRVINWVIATSYVGEVASGPRIGIEAGKRAAALGERVGVAELDELPAGIAADLVALGLSLVDATGLMEKLRGRADPAEVALAGKAAAIAEHALVRAAKPHPDGADAVAAVEAAARLLGAEEIFITLAADLGREKTFRRITGRPALGRVTRSARRWLTRASGCARRAVSAPIRLRSPARRKASRRPWRACRMVPLSRGWRRGWSKAAASPSRWRHSWVRG